ncbi:MAG: hypothetical protein OXG15_11620 [Gammaproteobacteria bacterium]|nr:hypothetical protein [Gammaproteobacteria bacterium]
MNEEIIATEKFDSQLRRTLVALLDTMIPANDEFNAPSAGTDSIVNDVEQSMSDNTPVMVSEMLNRLNEQSKVRFEDLDAHARWQAFTELQRTDGHALRALGGILLQCYYRNDQVLESLGMEARAPFPLGNEVEQGDWSLLDPVKARGSFYREV